jgi:chlorite dismutase
MPEQFLCHFACLQFTQRYWELSQSDRQGWAVRFNAELGARIPHHAVYQVFPSRAEADILLWTSFQVTSPEDPAGNLQDIACLLNPYRAYFKPFQILWGLTRPSDYAKGKSSQEIDPMSVEYKKYLVIYPFTKTDEWYRYSRDTRQGMMNEHIRVGHQYPQITQLLLYSTGLQDQEFVVTYETDDLGLFSSLVTELRSADGRPFTAKDTPIFTAVYHPVPETLGLFA